jgi:hypothetical protein
MNKRWDRTTSLTIAQSRLLDGVCQNTPGMTRYGNRARVSVMLELELAVKIARLSKQSGKTVNQVILNLLKSMEEK